MTKHTLKLNDRYFDAVANGIKTFEIRKNDRRYCIGDTLVLYRVDDAGKYLTDTVLNGERLTEAFPSSQVDCVEVKVKYYLTHNDFPAGIPEGYIVMGIERVKV